MQDLFRIWWSFVRVNIRKSGHQRRLARHPDHRRPKVAPCQAPSDDGQALQTRCQACLDLDRPARFRWVCPDLVPDRGELLCGRDASAVRPYWPRAFIGLVAPASALLTLAVGLIWLTLRSATPRHPPALLDLLLPSRWERLAEQKRHHYMALAAQALATGDHPTATVALFSAARQGRSDPATNTTLARLATLGGFHSLADELHLATVTGAEPNPTLRAQAAVAWLDDLLIARRPREIIRLSLDELTRPQAPRDLWLRAFFEASSTPGEAGQALDKAPGGAWPHPGLEAALRTRVALDARDLARASEHLHNFSRLLPGPSARRFLALGWMDANHLDLALAAALDPGHPDPDLTAPVLVYELEKVAGHTQRAHAAAQTAWALETTRPALRAALIRQPDPALLAEWSKQEASPVALSSLWIVARLLEKPDLARELARRLAATGHTVPVELAALNPRDAPLRFADLCASLLPCDRETLWALRSIKMPR